MLLEVLEVVLEVPEVVGKRWAPKTWLGPRLQKTTCCLLRGYPKIDSFLACFSSPGHGFGRDLVEMKPTDVPHLPI